jgi:predicted lipoprotein with Yx(FWY)xxD motif
VFPASRPLTAFFLSFLIAGLGLAAAAVLAFVVLPTVVRPDVQSPPPGTQRSARATALLPGGNVGEVSQRATSLGRILVDARGYTLYAFTKDSRDTDRCITVGGCTSVWPIARTGSSARAGRGVDGSLLGAISLPDGTRQVTYAGHPLYTYVGDGAPGDVSYVGVSQSGGAWPAIRASGALVR